MKIQRVHFVEAGRYGIAFVVHGLDEFTYFGTALITSRPSVLRWRPYAVILDLH